MLSEEMLQIGEENLQTHIQMEKEEEERKSLINPLQVWISSASAPACYHLIPLLANGEVFGITTEISIHLLDRYNCKEVLCGTVMEAQDLAYPLLRSVSMHVELDEAFLQADVIILLDDILLERDTTSFENCIRQVNELCKVYGPLIEKNAKSGVRIVVAGKTFVNLKALMIMTHAPSINPGNIIALAMLLESAAKAMLARKLNMNSAGIKDVIVWGNITGSSYIDLSNAKVYRYDSAIWGPPSFSRPLLDMIYDSKWLHSEFVTALSSLNSREYHCVGMSPAHVIATILRYWYQDSPPREIVSVGVLSEGQFCIPEGIVFSMPVSFQNGTWEVITETEINEKTQEIMDCLAYDLIQFLISPFSVVLYASPIPFLPFLQSLCFSFFPPKLLPFSSSFFGFLSFLIIYIFPPVNFSFPRPPSHLDFYTQTQEEEVESISRLRSAVPHLQ
uniref:Malate dehydrogenase 1B n=1 Tax=Crocodylus porosus TaxID=8502 RepID=A0A7M4E0M6_CROPO